VTATGQRSASISNEEPGWRAAAHFLTGNEARRIATDITKTAEVCVSRKPPIGAAVAASVAARQSTKKNQEQQLRESNHPGT
jgi:hypothetical protein